MSVRIVAPPLEWHHHPLPEVQTALAGMLEAWRGTRYESGQRFIQRGADCIGAVFGVIDDLDGRARAAFPGMPHDSAMHSRATAVAAMRELIRRYQPGHRVQHDPDGVTRVQPGDIVVTGEPGGGPGHVELVGARENELWHCLPGSGFHQGGWGLFATQLLWAVYRLDDQERWA